MVASKNKLVNSIRRGRVFGEFDRVDELIQEIESAKSKNEKDLLASRVMYICEKNKWYDTAANVAHMIGRSETEERYRSMHERYRNGPSMFLATDDGTVYHEKSGKYSSIDKRQKNEDLD